MNDCNLFKSEINEYLSSMGSCAYELKTPLCATFELTAGCNFRCPMCYVRLDSGDIQKRGGELTNEQWLSVAAQARELGVLFVTLTGGEVFSRPHFRELYEELSHMGFLINILTNGSLIDDDVIRWLAKMPPYSIRVSLYGASNETYKSFCGTDDGFDRVKKAIGLIKEAKIPLYLSSTLISDNFSDTDNILRFACENRLILYPTANVLNAVRGATSDAAGHRIDITNPDVQQLATVGRVERLYPRRSWLFDKCPAYRTSFWLTWDGKMTMCSFMEFPSVSIKNTSLAIAWDTLCDELSRLEASPKCTDCKYEGFCRRCPGILSAQCGSPNEPDNKFCENAMKLYELLSVETE